MGVGRWELGIESGGASPIIAPPKGSSFAAPSSIVHKGNRVAVCAQESLVLGLKAHQRHRVGEKRGIAPGGRTGHLERESFGPCQGRGPPDRSRVAREHPDHGFHRRRARARRIHVRCSSPPWHTAGLHGYQFVGHGRRASMRSNCCCIRGVLRSAFLQPADFSPQVGRHSSLTLTSGPGDNW